MGSALAGGADLGASDGKGGMGCAWTDPRGGETHRLPTGSSSVTMPMLRFRGSMATPRIMQMLGWWSFVISATSRAKPSMTARLFDA